MKVSKLVLVLVSASLISTSYAASIGRSGGFSSSRSFSTASQSYSRPASPATHTTPSYTAPAKTNVGGNSGSMGVQKSEVTAPVAAKVEAKRTASAPSQTTTHSPTPSYTAPTPSYSAPAYAPTSPTYSSPSPFWSSFGGSFAGSALGNMLFGGHHSGGGTTVINNGTPSTGNNGSVGGPGVVTDLNGNPAPYAAPKSEYGLGSLIKDVFLFAILIALLTGIGYLLYKGYKMVRNYVNKERGVGPTQPFSPTAQFWTIQKAFAAADEATLRTLIGPDMVDEATNNLTKFELNLRNVSHEVVLSNPREFSVHYSFVDGDDNETLDQVWHYEKHNGGWKLNGIENI